MDDARATTIRRVLPAAIAGLIFLGMAGLYLAGQKPVYDEILRAWGVDPYESPFVDTETILSAVRCLRAGVDVITVNPCDPLRRVFDYSPLWLLLAKFPVTEAWLVPAGLFVDIAFLLSVLLLPAGRSTRATMLIILGVLSTSVVFGVERANNDMVLFALASVAAALASRTPGLRLIGYAAAMLAGLLKYFPMSLLALTTQERPGRFFAVAAASVAVLALFMATLGEDFIRGVAVIPTGGWFGDMFGWTQLPGGLTMHFGWPEEVRTPLRITLGVSALVAGAVLGMRPAIRILLDRLTEAERMGLLAGGLLILSCFFTAQNIGYRATHLVLTLPALTAFGRLSPSRVWPMTTFAVVALLWSSGWRNWIGSLIEGRPAMVNVWMMREALWWWTITVMFALVIGLLARSELLARWRPAPMPAR